MFKLEPTSPLGGCSLAWEGFDLAERPCGEALFLTCALGSEAEFAAQFTKLFNAAPPRPNESVNTQMTHISWSGPNRYLVLLSEPDIYADKTYADQFAGLAYATLQTDGWAVIEVSGARLYDVMERFAALDLRREAVGFSARTSAQHIAMIAQKLAPNTLRLLTPRTTAQSFVSALSHTAENVCGAALPND